MTILEKILRHKEKEVAYLKTAYQGQRKPHIQIYPSLYDSFQQANTMNIIAEIKRASPSKGDLNLNVDPMKQALQYKQYGAGAISVLTDEHFFKGSMADLAAVRSAIQLPLLCKDFIIDPIQIDRAKDYGATVILLIAAALSKETLKALYVHAREQQLEVLLEIHDEKELETALDIGANIIGINNRNLKTFAVDLAVTEELASKIKSSNILLISESGIQTEADVERVKAVGIKGILVGETFMRSTNLRHSFAQFKQPI